MITLTIKGISKEAHQALKRRAATHGRSLNTETIAVLESSVRSQPLDVEGVLRRARAARATMKFVATDAEISRFKREGRR
jgi:plasmid stability protein